VGCPRGESRGVSRERTRYGQSQYHAGGRSWSDASRALPTGRSQGLVVENPSRALAGRKLEAPPDVGHEPREGETVRGIALTIKSRRWFGLWVSARRFSIRRKMFSGFCPYDPHRSCDAGSFGSRVNSQPHPSRRKSAGESRSMRRTAHRSAQRLIGRAYE